MSTERDKGETAAAKEVAQELRTRVADYLEKRAKLIEYGSTERHAELVMDDEEELKIIRSVADQHEAVVRRIAKEIKTPRSSIDDYRNFGEVFAATAVERRLSLRDAINGLLFLKSEMLQAITDGGFLLEMDSMEVKGIVDFIGTRIDVLFAELAVCYHRDFTERLEEQLAFREKQNRQKDLFIRIASHEIRNPLSTALLLCDLATAEAGVSEGCADAVGATFLEIRASLLLINRHLTQLLDMSLLEDDKLTLKKEKINLHALLERNKLSFERTAKDHTLTLNVSTPLYVETDRDRLEQIITNLLQNATKYSQPGSTIGLSLLQEASNAVITVTDHGEGIKEDDIERIFDPYLRLEKDREKAEGLGLGLYISRTLAHALGGTLTVESSVGVGSTFTLMLPLSS